MVYVELLIQSRDHSSLFIDGHSESREASSWLRTVD